MNTTISLENERWDQLASRTLKRADMDTVTHIIALNSQLVPAIRFAATLPGGLIIKLPDMQQIPAPTIGAAPWRR
ncbi:tail protein X [Pseudoalteromonas sp. Of7M-16]|uniref:tail protein X n=1 Tax=Pseudoalteromonas sp. Of7M-16 TaxID=2917756 RepID=UPI001EF491D0|nr:tail protein X [Pseudoalteromonas sp. Of7M-16]MCG7551345.1 tail protein X [Pseudoalteromonas sp. Of7M-16]